MSQFMICKSKSNLAAYGKCLVDNNICNKKMLLTVAQFHFQSFNMEDIWSIEHIHDYCDQAHELQNHTNAKIYQLLDSLYNVSEVIVLWYGDDYKDLDNIETKEELIKHVKNVLISSNLELYLLAKGAA